MRYLITRSIRRLRGLDDYSAEIECLLSPNGKHRWIHERGWTHEDMDKALPLNIVTCRHCSELNKELSSKDLPNPYYAEKWDPFRLVNLDYSLTPLGKIIDAITHPLQFIRGILWMIVLQWKSVQVPAQRIYEGPHTGAEWKFRQDWLLDVMRGAGMDPYRSYHLERISGTTNYEIVQAKFRWKFLGKVLPPIL